jgi:hypothetical protein
VLTWKDVETHIHTKLHLRRNSTGFHPNEEFGETLRFVRKGDAVAVYTYLLKAYLTRYASLELLQAPEAYTRFQL